MKAPPCIMHTECTCRSACTHLCDREPSPSVHVYRRQRSLQEQRAAAMQLISREAFTRCKPDSANRHPPWAICVCSFSHPGRSRAKHLVTRGTHCNVVSTHSTVCIEATHSTVCIQAGAFGAYVGSMFSLQQHAFRKNTDTTVVAGRQPALQLTCA